MINLSASLEKLATKLACNPAAISACVAVASAKKKPCFKYKPPWLDVKPWFKLILIPYKLSLVTVIPPEPVVPVKPIVSTCSVAAT